MPSTALVDAATPQVGGTRPSPRPPALPRYRRARQRGRARGGRRLLFSLAGAAVFAVAAYLFLRPTDLPLVGAFAGAPVAYASPSMGDPSAPVTVVWYSDFQCPFCAAWDRSVLPEFKRRYVDAGKVRLVMKNFQVRGPESRTAGQAAACAGEQSRFWDYHDSLYAHQRGENSGAFSNQNLKGFAQALGLDPAAFGGCLDSGRYRGAIDADFEQGRREGVTATPTFIVNGQQRVVGAQPIEAFARVIDPLFGGAGR